jgi:hypothetical protein
MNQMKVLLIGLISLGSAFAADFNGTWKGMMPTREGGSIPVAFVLKADRDTLTGTIASGSGQPREFEEGKVTGEQIQFAVTTTLATGDKRKTTYTGKMDGNQLKISALREGSTRPLEVSLERQ